MSLFKSGKMYIVIDDVFLDEFQPHHILTKLFLRPFMFLVDKDSVKHTNVFMLIQQRFFPPYTQQRPFLVVHFVYYVHTSVGITVLLIKFYVVLHASMNNFQCDTSSTDPDYAPFVSEMTLLSQNK